MDLEKKIRTKLLTADETLKHRVAIAQSDGKWACGCCGFQENSVIAWTPVKADDIRLSCLECHVYEDPWLYEKDVVVAWLPLHSIATVSHLVRLLALTGKTDLADWIVKDAEPSPETAASLKALFDAVRDTAAPEEDNSGTSLLGSKATSEKSDAVIVAMRKSVATGLAGVASDITEGVKAAEEAFKGISIADIITAMEVGPDVDRELMSSGIRFIPTAFSSTRIEGWDEPRRSIREMFMAELVEVAKLERKVPSASVEQEVEDAEFEFCKAEPEASFGPEADGFAEAKEPEGRTLKSLLAFFRLSGGRS
ncbi:hypothetical protein G6L37_34920 [Agrobacterium rubi]|nr:hypothetical protein [Agrobacterium rubi]NTF23762.1 hypothetical protein [Agrobacterium rubi]